mmetsp:Transcript_19931/g.56462  ORF Transcript_19931/g.56462 Transcript_19931/m.56462 type:complete len:426 (-) Transcript_19931:1099-2376(-)
MRTETIDFSSSSSVPSLSLAAALSVRFLRRIAVLRPARIAAMLIGGGFSPFLLAFNSRATLISLAQNTLFSVVGATSLISNMTNPATQMHRILTTVRAKEIAPMMAKSLASLPLSESTAPEWRIAAYTQHTPEFTAGGNSDAEMATPTKLPVFPPRMPRQTPIPDGIAIAIPVSKPESSPRISISLVGQSSSANGLNAATTPTRAPTTTHPRSARHSFCRDCLTKGQSLMRLPNVRPRTGPMMGDTSILATITTVLFVMRPTPARMLAIVTRLIKSNENDACSTICSRTCSMRNRVAAFFHSDRAASIIRSLRMRSASSAFSRSVESSMPFAVASIGALIDGANENSSACVRLPTVEHASSASRCCCSSCSLMAAYGDAVLHNSNLMMDSVPHMMPTPIRSKRSKMIPNELGRTMTCKEIQLPSS